MMQRNWNWLYDPDVLNDIYFFGDNEEQENAFIPEKIHKKRERNQYMVKDSYNSVFYKTYILPSLAQDSTICDLANHVGAKFRRWFRVPYAVFKEICEDIQRMHNLSKHRYNAKGEESVKIGLLVLGSLCCIASICTH
jgi:hypothetical protein